jgi:hypothetical protein
MLKDIDVRIFNFNGGFLEKTVSFLSFNQSV